jgi:hypothetical protein
MARESDVRSAAGRRAKKTNGSAPAGHIWNTTPDENHFAMLRTGEMGID